MTISRIWIGLLVVALSVCAVGCDKEQPDAKSAGPPAAEKTTRRADDASALEQAWKKEAACQQLQRCCEGIAGSSWETTLKGFCNQVKAQMYFDKQAQGGMKPAYLAKRCGNSVKGMAGMANASNPLPKACQAK